MTSTTKSASKNVRINPKTFLTFSFNPFCHIGVRFEGYTLCQSQIIDLESRSTLKKSGFSVQIIIKLRLSLLLS